MRLQRIGCTVDGSTFGDDIARIERSGCHVFTTHLDGGSVGIVAALSPCLRRIDGDVECFTTEDAHLTVALWNEDDHVIVVQFGNQSRYLLGGTGENERDGVVEVDYPGRRIGL